MVIRTFCQPEASEPVDTERLTLSSAPFVIQRQRVRWHAGNTLWLSAPFVNQGKRDRWYRDDVGCPILIILKFLQVFTCHLETTSSMICGEYLMIICTFRQPRRTSLMVSGWCWSPDSNYFLKSLQVLPFVIQRRQVRWHAGVFTLIIRRHSSPTMHEILLC